MEPLRSPLLCAVEVTGVLGAFGLVWGSLLISASKACACVWKLLNSHETQGQMMEPVVMARLAWWLYTTVSSGSYNGGGVDGG